LKKFYVLFAAILVLSLAGFGAGTARAASEGTWTHYPAQATVYESAVQQPINADGSSVFRSSGNNVIPVKFSLASGTGAFVFESMASSESYSWLKFTSSGPMTFADITTLSANYGFATGNCHGGALRWTVSTSEGSFDLFYGALPNFTDCMGSNLQSGVNMLATGDARFDLTRVGGTYYDTYANAVVLVGDAVIQQASLILDGGWGGDQKVNLTSATVNDNTYTAPSAAPPAPTCDLPEATIRVTRTDGASQGLINEPVSVQPGDDNSMFRVANCIYMYNLRASSLSGAGTYKVEVLIDGTPASNPATFKLR
jgi:hypothetical protein